MGRHDLPRCVRAHTQPGFPVALYTQSYRRDEGSYVYCQEVMEIHSFKQLVLLPAPSDFPKGFTFPKGPRMHQKEYKTKLKNQT